MANPALGEGTAATAKTDVRHVSLRVEYTQTGWVARVVETDGGTEVAHEMVDSLEGGQHRAEEIAKSYLADKDVTLPAIKWKKIE